MNVLDAINKRKAIKAYKSGAPITDDQLDKIIEAGRLAPTANNVQNNTILILRSPEARKKYQKGLHDFNQQYALDAEAIVFFVGLPWEMVSKNDGQWIYDVDVHAYDAPEDTKRQIVNGVLTYYKTRSSYADVIDYYTSATMFAFMSLTATELGFGTTPMVGIAKADLEKMLLADKLIEPGQRVNLAMAIGYEDEDNERNKIHTRIRMPKEKQFKIL